MDKFYNFFFLLLFFSFGSIFSQSNEPIISTKIDTTTIKVGEQISYEIKIESNDIGDVFFPEKYQFSPFVIAEEFPLDTIDFQRKKSITKRFRLTNFDEGNFLIKPQEIIFGNKKLYSDSLLIEVLTVEVGTTVEWDNIDTTFHSVTAGTPPADMTGVFDSEMMGAGDKFEYTFSEAGTFDYFCIFHPWMVRTVNVE